MIKNYGDGGHSVATSLPYLASLGHLTADKRFALGSPKPTLWPSFIRKTLSIIYMLEVEKLTVSFINARKDCLWKINRKMEGEKNAESFHRESGNSER